MRGSGPKDPESWGSLGGEVILGFEGKLEVCSTSVNKRAASHSRSRGAFSVTGVPNSGCLTGKTLSDFLGTSEAPSSGQILQSYHQKLFSHRDDFILWFSGIFVCFSAWQRCSFISFPVSGQYLWSLFPAVQQVLKEFF